MRFLYLIHDPRWTESRVTDLMVERGHQVDYRCHQSGDPLPSLGEFGESYDGLIIGGGFVSVDAAPSQPFMARQIEFTRAVVDHGHRFFGLCLGAHILGAAYGASVGPRPDGAAEFGFCPIAATAAGAKLFAGTTRVYQVHDEGLWDLPVEAELLAESDTFPIQAFGIGHRAFGVQFHPDAPSRAIESWWHDNTRLHGRIGAQSLPDQLDDAKRLEQSRTRWLNRFLDQWLSPVASNEQSDNEGEPQMAPEVRT